jgi:hypothetical protein
VANTELISRGKASRGQNERQKARELYLFAVVFFVFGARGKSKRERESAQQFATGNMSNFLRANAVLLYQFSGAFYACNCNQIKIYNPKPAWLCCCEDTRCLTGFCLGSALTAACFWLGPPACFYCVCTFFSFCASPRTCPFYSGHKIRSACTSAENASRLVFFSRILCFIVCAAAAAAADSLSASFCRRAHFCEKF